MDTKISTAPTRPTIAVTVSAAAELLSVSSRTIHRLARCGQLRIVRITPDTPRVLIADIEAFLAAASGHDGDGQVGPVQAQNET